MLMIIVLELLAQAGALDLSKQARTCQSEMAVIATAFALGLIYGCRDLSLAGSIGSFNKNRKLTTTYIAQNVRSVSILPPHYAVNKLIQ
ncbi:hypothetical protein ACJX0J_022162, partial [Zea mays]